jgi:hypothetical protein
MGGVHLGLLALRLVVEGTCPSAAMIEARLGPMLPPDALAEVAAAARIEPLDEEFLRVEVRTDGGVLLTVRDLARSTSCADLADVAAVVIGTALSSAPRTAPVPLPLLPVVVPPQPPPPAPPRVTWDLALAGVLALGGGRPSGGGSLAAGLGPIGARWGLRLQAAATALRHEPVGDGEAQWTRASLFAGPRCRLRPGAASDPEARLLIDLHAAAGAALVSVAGQGFAQDKSSLGWDAGLLFGAQLGVRAGRGPVSAVPFLGAQLVAYLRPQELRVLGSEVAGRLPAIDVLLAAGLMLGSRL